MLCSFYTYVNTNVSTRVADIKILDERVADVPYGQFNVGSLDGEGLEAVEVAWDGNKDLEGHGLFELFFQGCMDCVCVLVAVLYGLECGCVLDDGLACLY